MGFNKRYLNEKILRTVLYEDGMGELISFVKKADSLIIEDDFSREVSTIVLETEEEHVIEKLLEIF